MFCAKHCFHGRYTHLDWIFEHRCSWDVEKSRRLGQEHYLEVKHPLWVCKIVERAVLWSLRWRDAEDSHGLLNKYLLFSSRIMRSTLVFKVFLKVRNSILSGWHILTSFYEFNKLKNSKVKFDLTSRIGQFGLVCVTPAQGILQTLIERAFVSFSRHLDPL